MKLYHWLFRWHRHDYSFLVVAESEALAREYVMREFDGWLGQHVEMFQMFAESLKLPPYRIADPGHVLTIGL